MKALLVSIVGCALIVLMAMHDVEPASGQAASCPPLYSPVRDSQLYEVQFDMNGEPRLCRCAGLPQITTHGYIVRDLTSGETIFVPASEFISAKPQTTESAGGVK